MFWDDLLKHWKDRLLKKRPVLVFHHFFNDMGASLRYAMGCIIYGVKSGSKRRGHFEYCIGILLLVSFVSHL